MPTGSLVPPLTRGEVRYVVNSVDNRKMAFWFDPADTDAAIEAALFAISDAAAGIMSNASAGIYIVVETADGRVLTPSMSGHTTSGTSSNAIGSAGSPLGLKYLFKDYHGKVSHHMIHGVKSDYVLTQADFLTHAPGSGDAFVTAVVNNCYTKSGYLLTASVGVRTAFQRDKASGGQGRRLTIKRAAKFLYRHGINDFVPHSDWKHPSPYPSQPVTIP